MYMLLGNLPIFGSSVLDLRVVCLVATAEARSADKVQLTQQLTTRFSILCSYSWQESCQHPWQCECCAWWQLRPQAEGLALLVWEKALTVACSMYISLAMTFIPRMQCLVHNTSARRK